MKTTMASVRVVRRLRATLIALALLAGAMAPFARGQAVPDPHNEPAGGTAGPSAPVPSTPYWPAGGVVPDEATAIAIGAAVLRPLFGSADPRASLRAALDGGRWIVTGRVSAGKTARPLRVEIAKEDGRVLRITRGQ